MVLHAASAFGGFNFGPSVYGGFVLDPSALSLFRILPFERVSSRPYGSFSCRFCGFPGRCVFDGFLQDFEAFKGYVRPPVGPSVFGWLGLNPAGVSLFRMHRPLHVLGALKFKAEAATEAAIPSPSTTWFCMFLERFPEGAFSMASYRILRRSKGTLGPLSGRLSLAGWAWILLGFPCFACIVHSMFSGPLSSRPKLPPKLPFHPRPLHGFACFWNGSQKVRFRWLPTGFWGVQRVR